MAAAAVEMDAPGLSPRQLGALRVALESSFLLFVRYFFRVREGVPFIVNDHHILIAKTLEAVHRGEKRNVVFNVPPGSSKTEMVVIAFMAWTIARNPRCRHLHLSFADTLVQENSAKTKELIQSEEFQALWPLQIAKDSKARARWNVMVKNKRAGGCYAVPLGGTITGFRAGHMSPGFQGALLIDDPLKPEDAFSEPKLKAANRKLSDTVRSRKAKPDTPVIIIMQRLHVDDPTAYAMAGKIGGLQFEQIKVAALNEDGSSYWEFKEPAAELVAWRDANPYTFAGQMQQEPTVLGGTIFKGSWWQFWDVLPEIVLVKIFGDTAMKTGERNDFSVFQAWGLGADGSIYLLDQIREKWEAPQLQTEAAAFWAKWAAQPMGEAVPPPSAMMIEDKASGTGLIQSLAAETSIPVLPIKREVDKLVRAISSAPSIQAGRVFLPSAETRAPAFLSEYMAEFAAFNAEGTHKHDDQIDPTMDAIHDLVLGGADFYSRWL